MARTRTKTPSEPAAPERPKGYRKSVNIGFDANALADIDTILEEMLRDPGLRALKAELGIAKITRWGLAKYAQILRAQAPTG